MKTELKGWLADNTVTTDNKEDKILVLESAGNLTLSDVLDEMKKEDTGLRAETLKHAVDLFLHFIQYIGQRQVSGTFQYQDFVFFVVGGYGIVRKPAFEFGFHDLLSLKVNIIVWYLLRNG